MKTGTIYGLVCPIENRVVYVGQTFKSLDKRLRMHKVFSSVGTSALSEWILLLKESSLLDGLTIVSLEDEIPAALLNEKEQGWIAFYRLDGTLLNERKGGESNAKKHSAGTDLLRYIAIDKAIRSGGTKERLIEAAESICNAKVSFRTIERDIRTLRTDKDLKLFAPIVYNRSEKRFNYSDPTFTLIAGIVKAFYSHEADLSIGSQKSKAA